MKMLVVLLAFVLIFPFPDFVPAPPPVPPPGVVDQDGVFWPGGPPHPAVTCLQAPVTGGPGTYSRVIRVLEPGSLIRIREFSKGYAMIEVARWIPVSSICEDEP